MQDAFTVASEKWPTDGLPPSRSRALARYIACCLVWFLPATLIARLWHLAPWPSLGVAAAGIAVYALSTLAEPNRQFWHDRLCRTRLIGVGR